MQYNQSHLDEEGRESTQTGNSHGSGVVAPPKEAHKIGTCVTDAANENPHEKDRNTGSQTYVLRKNPAIRCPAGQRDQPWWSKLDHQLELVHAVASCLDCD